MDEAERARLEEAGPKVGSAAEFLELSDDEAAFVEMKLRLSEALRERRTEQGLMQAELAKRIGSSQSRAAKMEPSDPAVSVDLLLRALLATGATRKEIAAAIAPGKRRPPALRSSWPPQRVSYYRCGLSAYSPQVAKAVRSNAF